MDNNFAIAIHGGAGNIHQEKMPEEDVKAYHEQLNIALNAGHKVLEKKGSSILAVEAAINIMEDSSLFNAGKGSVFTHKETIEMDAAIMDGNTLEAGAVAGTTKIKNPIGAARAIMEKSPHVMLLEKGAEEFAEEHGIEMMDPSYFFDQKRFDELQRIKDTDKMLLDHSAEPNSKFGTVGAVALDQHGNLAAGTSTGGITNKRYGRIGDSPIIGGGTYANNSTCAVSCTGYGEYFIRLVVAHDISALMEYKNMGLKEATELLVHDKLTKLGGEGGLISIDKQGNISMPFNTRGMYRGFKKSNGKSDTSIY